jgi:hypothetical protein
MQPVAADSVSHRCTACGSVWWWALCRSCNALQRIPATVESWRCGCRTANRSWWRTAERDREAIAEQVTARRQSETRLLPRPSAPVIVGLAMAVLAVIGLTVARSTLTGDDGSDAAGGSGSAGTCRAFRDYRSKVMSGAEASPVVVAQLAASASPDLRDAADRLLAASRTGNSDEVLAAAADITRICHPNGNG